MSFQCEFKIEKETKGAVRYQEVAKDGAELIGTLYVRKSGLLMHDLGETPATLIVSVEVGGNG